MTTLLRINSITIFFILLQIELNAILVFSLDAVTLQQDTVNYSSTNLNFNKSNQVIISSEHVADIGGALPTTTALPSTTDANQYVATTSQRPARSGKALNSAERDEDDEEYEGDGGRDSDGAILKDNGESRQYNNNEENDHYDVSNILSVLKFVSAVVGTPVVKAGSAAPSTARGNNNRNDVLSTNSNTTEPTESASSAVAVQEGRYIKGDPLNGYYDYIVTEGSYKFWAAFQLATAALIIYSTFAAIYYSKVNPLTSDYDYIDYLSKRSFSGRSLTDDSDSIDIDVGDGEGATGSSGGEGRSQGSGGESYWSSLVTGQWLSSATHSFQFVLDAIEKVPQ